MLHNLLYTIIYICMHIYIYIYIYIYVDKLREIFRGQILFSNGIDSVMIAKEHVAYTYFCQYLEDCFKGIFNLIYI